MYLVSEKKVSGVSSTYMDSLYYSDDQGATIQALADHPDYSFDRHSFYIDPQDNFYCLSSSLGPNLSQQYEIYKDGQMTCNMFTGFSAGSSGLRSLIKLGNGNFVTSSFNSGVRYSTDGGATWIDSQNDGDLGNATYAIFAEADNGTILLSGPTLVQCSDGGETWTTSSLGVNFVNGVRKAGNGTLYAAGEFASPSLYESTDNGATWVGLQNQPAAGFYDWDLSNSHLFVAFKDSILYQTPVASGGVGMGENSIQTSALQIYPNPVQAEINIVNDQFNGDSWVLEIRDLSGVLIYRDICYERNFPLQREVLSDAGMYLVRAYASDGDILGETRVIKM
jgi:hypothetical protein